MFEPDKQVLFSLAASVCAFRLKVGNGTTEGGVRVVAMKEEATEGVATE